MKLLLIFGTRPEAIKMAPLVMEWRKRKLPFELEVCVTAQHREMLDQVLKFFDIDPRYDLNLMQDDQLLSDFTARCIGALNKVLDDARADILFVQGDTTTTFAGALCGYYRKIKVAHLEAGLRSGNKYSPFPEEMNRILASRLADYHFAPTQRAVENLKKEGISTNVWKVGNTGIDALLISFELVKQRGEDGFKRYFDFLDFSKRILLVTGHRRESFGKPFESICHALGEIADNFSDVEIIYPVHLNPNVRDPVHRILNNHPGIHLINPLEYPYLIWLMNKSYLVLTDSGGIQEEAPSLGKPVLVMRDVTERIEGVEAGTAKLVKTDRKLIIEEASRLLQNKDEYEKMSNAVNPYGDGKSSQKIFEILQKEIKIDSSP